MDLSIVTTLYASAAYVQEFYTRITAEAEKITSSYEIILVNDGSPDHSLALALKLHDSDPHVKVIDLSRNFGHHKAIMTGLEHSRGNLVFLIDCDLEEKPELLAEFYEIYRTSDVDVVYGVQTERGGSLVRRLSGRVFYNVFNFLSDIKLHQNLLTVRLMSRRYVQALLTCRENELIIAGLWAFVGFEQKAVKVAKETKGSSAYSLQKKLRLVVRSVTAFSARPLIYIAYLGFAILFGAVAYIFYIFGLLLLGGRPPSGYSSLIVSVWFLGGLIIFCQGIIATYVSVLFNEVKQRPYTVVRAVYEVNGAAHEAPDAAGASSGVLYRKG